MIIREAVAETVTAAAAAAAANYYPRKTQRTPKTARDGDTNNRDAKSSHGHGFTHGVTLMTIIRIVIEINFQS